MFDDCLKILFSSLAALLVLAVVLPIAKRNKIRKQILALSAGSAEMTPAEFIRMRNARLGGRGAPHISSQYNYAGVYILYNQSKNMYYVGQGKQVLDRINHHLTGKGNGDVYADYKYGDRFTIKTIALRNSGFSSLNELERHTIMAYNSYAKGYNKTRGNK